MYPHILRMYESMSGSTITRNNDKIQIHFFIHTVAIKII